MGPVEMLLGGLPNHQTTLINETNMSKKGHTKEAQIKAIRDYESGRTQAEICKELNITAQTFYRWKKQHGMMTNSDAQ
jgi:transposase-like protein